MKVEKDIFFRLFVCVLLGKNICNYFNNYFLYLSRELKICLK